MCKRPEKKKRQEHSCEAEQSVHQRGLFSCPGQCPLAEGLDLAVPALTWAGTPEVVRMSNAYKALGTNAWHRSQMPWFIYGEQVRDLVSLLKKITFQTPRTVLNTPRWAASSWHPGGTFLSAPHDEFMTLESIIAPAQRCPWLSPKTGHMGIQEDQFSQLREKPQTQLPT